MSLTSVLGLIANLVRRYKENEAGRSDARFLDYRIRLAADLEAKFAEFVKHGGSEKVGGYVLLEHTTDGDILLGDTDGNRMAQKYATSTAEVTPAQERSRFRLIAGSLDVYDQFLVTPRQPQVRIGL